MRVCRRKQQGKIEVVDPVGTGHLSQARRLHGILTARLVLQEFVLQETVGLVRFPSIQPSHWRADF